ncbi:MAG: AAA family ATPase [Flavobacteriales bacterium]|nr:AAA family ATPase [Flavobacteriales bacterium]
MDSIELNVVFEDNAEWKTAWQIIHEENRSVNLSGKAGTGKSTFIKALKKFSSKKILLTAPTGLAALNINGVTLHSLFGLPFGLMLPNDSRLKRHSLSQLKKKLLKKCDLLVIDEISMVRADVLDAIDLLLQKYCKDPMPFGGKQVVLVGDNFQLEPVVRNEERDLLYNHYESPYYFSSKVFNRINIEKIELKKVYRQTDPYFISLLNQIRVGTINEYELAELNSRQIAPESISKTSEFSIILAPKSITVSLENLIKLKAIKSREYTSEALILGRFNPSSYPTDEVLRLKEGAQIIMVKNDKNRNWVNGSLGIIKSISENNLLIKLENGKLVDVFREDWEQIEYDFDKSTQTIKENVVGTFRQFPVKLAWAITIHKSQGLTFSRVVLNLEGGTFASGQLYVALSRCRSLEGLYLTQKIEKSDIKVNTEILKYSGLGKYIE